MHYMYEWENGILVRHQLLVGQLQQQTLGGDLGAGHQSGHEAVEVRQGRPSHLHTNSTTLPVVLPFLFLISIHYNMNFTYIMVSQHSNYCCRSYSLSPIAYTNGPKRVPSWFLMSVRCLDLENETQRGKIQEYMAPKRC